MAGQNRNLFRITRLILLYLPFLFRFFTLFRRPGKNLLIIKTDAIGDYILFRNFLEVVRHSRKFQNYQITLLGNELWEDLAIEFDIEFVNEFIFTKTDNLYYQPIKTLLLGWRLFKGNYETVLQPSFTRLFITDGLAALTAAENIIGFNGDNESILTRYKIKTDKFYTTKLMLPMDTSFEFNRSKFFFENILQQPIQLTAPFINVKKTGNNGIIILPGSGNFKRSWGNERFLSLVRLIKQHGNHQVYFAGGPTEVEAADYLISRLPSESITNLTGKTTLPQLVALISGAALVISNETSAIHIAAAVKTKSVCILGGGHFNRFAPYSGNSLYNPVFIHEKMDCFNCNWRCKFFTADNEAYPCISTINFDKVWRATLQLLLALETQKARIRNKDDEK